MPDVGSAIGAGGSLIGGLIGGSSAEDAAQTQADAANAAAQAQLQGVREQIAAQKEATAQERADLEPWRTAGKGGLDMVQRLLGINPAVTDHALTYSQWREQNKKERKLVGGVDKTRAAYDKYLSGWKTDNTASRKANRALTPEAIMELDPGYQFRLREGTRAIDQASALARGPGLSGATLKELERYGSDYASAEFGNVFNRASSLSSQGLGAATGQANFTQAGALNNANTANVGLTNSLNFGLQGANATAAGQVASGNALGSALNNIGQQIYLKDLLRPTNSAPIEDHSWIDPNR